MSRDFSLLSKQNIHNDSLTAKQYDRPTKNSITVILFFCSTINFHFFSTSIGLILNLLVYLKRQTGIDTDYSIFSDDEIFDKILCQMTKIN